MTLSDEKKRQIYKLYEDKESIQDISTKVGLSYFKVYYIIKSYVKNEPIKDPQSYADYLHNQIIRLKRNPNVDKKQCELEIKRIQYAKKNLASYKKYY